MSENSSSSCGQGTSRRCRCGIIASHFTAWTPYNAGRRFYKCPHSGVSSCGYWEWRDEEFPMQAAKVINNLKSSLDVVSQERDNLKKMVVEMEVIKSTDMDKLTNLQRKIQKIKTILFVSWALILVFVAARMI